MIVFSPHDIETPSEGPWGGVGGLEPIEVCAVFSCLAKQSKASVVLVRLTKNQWWLKGSWHVDMVWLMDELRPPASLGLDDPLEGFLGAGSTLKGLKDEDESTCCAPARAHAR